jgi:hypothetical protein
MKAKQHLRVSVTWAEAKMRASLYLQAACQLAYDAGHRDGFARACKITEESYKKEMLSRAEIQAGHPGGKVTSVNEGINSRVWTSPQGFRYVRRKNETKAQFWKRAGHPNYN